MRSISPTLRPTMTSDIEMQTLSQHTTRASQDTLVNISHTADRMEATTQAIKSPLLSKKRLLLTSAVAAVITGSVVGGVKGYQHHQAVKAAKLAATLEDAKVAYCSQFASFSWIVPNSTPAISAVALNNYHNEPADLSSSCYTLFNTNGTVPNPQPNAVGGASAGPFPLKEVFDFDCSSWPLLRRDGGPEENNLLSFQSILAFSLDIKALLPLPNSCPLTDPNWVL
jgi:hypothetical protein